MVAVLNFLDHSHIRGNHAIGTHDANAELPGGRFIIRVTETAADTGAIHNVNQSI